MSLFDRNKDVPGLRSHIRDCRTDLAALGRASAGDIIVIDRPDLTYAYAARLCAARPAAVINQAATVSGTVPVHGPQLLCESGIKVVDGFPDGALDGLKDGKKALLSDGGELYVGNNLLGQGRIIDADLAQSLTHSARTRMVDTMDAFFGNTVQFLSSESPMLIDGFGVPTPEVSLAGKKVLVVCPSPQLSQQLVQLRSFIREYEPVIIAVDNAADGVVAAGYTPDLIVGNPAVVDAQALKCGARVIIPAAPDGHAPGLERLQDLGIGALTFPAVSTSATDLALILAATNQAAVVVYAGTDISLVDYLQGTADPSALLTRMVVSGRLVHASTIAELYNVSSPPNLTWLWVFLGLMAIAAVVVAIAGFTGGGDFLTNLHSTWDNVLYFFSRMVEKF